jgi:hypothetical protein
MPKIIRAEWIFLEISSAGSQILRMAADLPVRRAYYTPTRSFFPDRIILGLLLDFGLEFAWPTLRAPRQLWLMAVQ